VYFMHNPIIMRITKMPPKMRRSTSLAAFKVTRKQGLKTTAKKGQISQRSGKQMLRVRFLRYIIYIARDMASLLKRGL
jgi:hypothetical protein